MPEDRIIKKTLFVVNPISGDIDKKDLISKIKVFMNKHNQPVQFYSTTGDNDKENIIELIDKFSPETVVAIGGDGTCNLVASTILGKPIKLGIIPLGSANGLATELNLPANLQENLKLITDGKLKKIDVLKINNSFISLHLSDIGFNAQIIKSYEKGESRGLTGYIKSFIDEVGEAKPAKFEIRFNDKTLKKEAFMIVLGNASKFGTGAVINPTGLLDDGYFEVIVIRLESFRNFLQMLIPFYTGSIHTLDFVETFTCKQVKILNHERQDVQIDGEIIGQPNEVNVEILPRSLQVIIP